MEIQKQLQNKLLNREEIVAIIESEITPSKQDVAKIISEQTKKPVENIVVEKITGNFGTKIFKIEAKVYDNLESKEKYETTTKKQRAKIAEEAKAATEAKAAEKKAAEEAAEKPEEKSEEAPAEPETKPEEKSEEPKPEEKTE